jgi:hypothetical protein
MKNLFTLLLTVISFCATAQNTEVNYDADIIDYVIDRWSNSASKFQRGKEKIDDFKKIERFFVNLIQKRTTLISDTFLTKPSDNLLFAHYLNLMFQWNKHNPAAGLEKLSDKKVVKNTVSNLPKRHELLAFYYLTVFSHTLNNSRPLNLSSVNINLENLNLSDDTEKTILFLCAMRHLGRQVYYYSSLQFPNNCFRALDYVENLPRINGRPFYEFVVPEFEDFEIKIDKRYPKESFKKHFLQELDNAKTGYFRCLKVNENTTPNIH